MRRVATLQSAGQQGAGRNKCFEERNFSPCYYIGCDLLWPWVSVCISEMYNKAVKVGSLYVTEGDLAGGPQGCTQ